MTFNVINDGDPVLAAPVMQNWRHVNYGSALLPVNTTGSSVDDTLDLGSSTYQWKDLYIDGTAYIDNLSVASVVFESDQYKTFICDNSMVARSGSPTIDETGGNFPRIDLNSNTDEAWLPIDLIDNSTITSFTVYADDSGSSTGVAELRRKALASPFGETVMSSISLAGAGGPITDTTISSATVDNATYAYYLAFKRTAGVKITILWSRAGYT